MRWISYFPEIHNIHLTKDLGLLPYFMQKVLGYEASLAARFPEEDYPALQGEVSGLQTLPLTNQGTWFFTEKAFLKYLKYHSKKIDVLNLYHLSRHTLVYGYLYKKYNRQGLLYLKMDAYTTHLQTRKRYARNPLKNAILKWVESQFFKVVDLISVESRQGLQVALKTYPQLQKELFYLPNGCNDIFLKNHFKSPVAKENTILSVGRPGSSDKNYKLLIEALPFLTLRDWKIKIVGSVSAEFNKKWKEAEKKYPEQTSKIDFLGNFNNRLKLYEEFARSKVFFLPSRVESFGIAFAEALYFGNVLLGHKGLSAYADLSANGKYGAYFNDNDPESFVKGLNNAMHMSRQIGLQEDIEEHAAQNFYWSKLAINLDRRLKNV